MRVINTAAAAALVLGGWSAACGVASADPPAPAPPAPKTTIDADGTYVVGTDIAPGTYASAGPANNGTCSWKRTSAANQTLDNAISHKSQVVAIDPTDATFKTNGCQAWALTDASPPASVSNLQAQAMMTLLGGLAGGLGGGGGAQQAPAPSPQATGPSPQPPGPSPQGAGQAPGPAVGPAPGPLLPAGSPTP
jgi:hypothetical protein